MTRGYSVVALFGARNRENIGHACRAAQAFGAAMFVLHGKRYQKSPTDTGRAWRHLPLIETDDLASAIPYDCVPVAVEVVEGAQSLAKYRHTERAFYIFGPEDGSIPEHILARCRDTIRIPAGCLNLAAAVNVVLYDRTAKAEGGGE